ncbi:MULTISPECIES: LysR family transcriptional regulator [Methylomonas]|uniref:LysR family transcriptional regulator n=2 Tax=Methylomonas TaxID=416 RepID=A0A126T946_9GAMM|nr:MULTISPECIES: LysR family transcriptional regulator [Methylomonas]AMK78548.1 LysR family transcriptional regulator [Methylomonas denitrificans]OAI06458.1 LysR family transcriptional regulator [Methylomonas methanica]TCV77380.1 DNA-binding transcriptional LysR family regulator [Methylomonas methanica]
MEMQQIRYFLAVCDKGSFTRAAQSTYVAQPSLTQAIKKLEDELGGELFSRERSGCRLTSLGRLVEPTLRQIFREAQTIKAEAIRFSRLNTVPLRIGMLTTIAAQHLSPFFADFQQERPHLELELVVDNESNLLLQLDEDRLDLVVSAPTSPLPAQLQSLKLYEERYVVVFNDKHRFNQLSVIDLAAIQSEPYLDRLNCELRETLRGVCMGKQIDLYAAYRSNSEEWILGMVRAGIGVALMPEFSVPKKVDELKFRYLSDPEIRRTVCAIYPVSATANPEVNQLLGRLRTGFC